MRKAFSDTLVKIAKDDQKIAFITGDLGFQVFDEFETLFPGRYINAGVSEAQMVCAAAGMAYEGYRPIAYSIASFASARPFEQIRFCVAYPNLPIMIVGAGRGYTYAKSGVSHHAPDDLGLMASMPNMTVVSPGDPGEIEQLFPQLAKLNGPSYFTVGRFGEPRFEALEPATVGKARLVQKGENTAILTTGEIANEALRAIDILASDSIKPSLYQFHTIKPLDTERLAEIDSKYEHILVVEEHLPHGGLWQQIAGWRADNNGQARLSRLGPGDVFALGNLQQDELRKRMGFDAEAIAQTYRELAISKNKGKLAA